MSLVDHFSIPTAHAHSLVDTQSLPPGQETLPWCYKCVVLLDTVSIIVGHLFILRIWSRPWWFGKEGQCLAVWTPAMSSGLSGRSGSSLACGYSERGRHLCGDYTTAAVWWNSCTCSVWNAPVVTIYVIICILCCPNLMGITLFIRIYLIFRIYLHNLNGGVQFGVQMLLYA